MKGVAHVVAGVVVPTEPPEEAYPPCCRCGARRTGLYFPHEDGTEPVCRECAPELFVYESYPQGPPATCDYAGSALAVLVGAY